MKIMVIDGNSIINRAYHGIRPLSNHEGTPTNAVYGFLSTLFKQQDEERPDRTVVCFDVKEKTFRHLKFARDDLTHHLRRPAFAGEQREELGADEDEGEIPKNGIHK